jgi:hypothetical protein
MKAAARVLVELGRREELRTIRSAHLDEDSRRRLGYLAARASEFDGLDSNVVERLERFAEQLHRKSDSSEAPLAIISNPSDRYLELLASRGDAVSARWQVYGDVSPD